MAKNGMRIESDGWEPGEQGLERNSFGKNVERERRREAGLCCRQARWNAVCYEATKKKRSGGVTGRKFS